jgi:hypothetical protein
VTGSGTGGLHEQRGGPLFQRRFRLEGLELEWYFSDGQLRSLALALLFRGRLFGRDLGSRTTAASWPVGRLLGLLNGLRGFLGRGQRGGGAGRSTRRPASPLLRLGLVLLSLLALPACAHQGHLTGLERRKMAADVDAQLRKRFQELIAAYAELYCEIMNPGTGHSSS